MAAETKVKRLFPQLRYPKNSEFRDVTEPVPSHQGYVGNDSGGGQVIGPTTKDRARKTAQIIWSAVKLLARANSKKERRKQYVRRKES